MTVNFDYGTASERYDYAVLYYEDKSTRVLENIFNNIKYNKQVFQNLQTSFIPTSLAGTEYSDIFMSYDKPEVQTKLFLGPSTKYLNYIYRIEFIKGTLDAPIAKAVIGETLEEHDNPKAIHELYNWDKSTKSYYKSIVLSANSGADNITCELDVHKSDNSRSLSSDYEYKTIQSSYPSHYNQLKFASRRYKVGDIGVRSWSVPSTINSSETTDTYTNPRIGSIKLFGDFSKEFIGIRKYPKKTYLNNISKIINWNIESYTIDNNIYSQYIELPEYSSSDNKFKVSYRLVDRNIYNNIYKIEQVEGIYRIVFTLDWSVGDINVDKILKVEYCYYDDIIGKDIKGLIDVIVKHKKTITLDIDTNFCYLSDNKYVIDVCRAGWITVPYSYTFNSNWLEDDCKIGFRLSSDEHYHLGYNHKTRKIYISYDVLESITSGTPIAVEVYTNSDATLECNNLFYINKIDTEKFIGNISFPSAIESYECTSGERLVIKDGDSLIVSPVTVPDGATQVKAVVLRFDSFYNNKKNNGLVACRLNHRYLNVALCDEIPATRYSTEHKNSCIIIYSMNDKWTDEIPDCSASSLTIYSSTKGDFIFNITVSSDASELSFDESIASMFDL